MTKKDFLRELKSYFTDIDWTPAAESRVNLLLESYHTTAKTKVLVKHIYVDREVMVEGSCAKEMDYAKIAEEVCRNHNITLEQLKVSSPNWAYKDGRKGTRELVDARHEFVNKVFARFPHSSKVQTSRWLGYTCHSSVYHLLKDRKI
jgi:hypothetical protein